MLEWPDRTLAAFQHYGIDPADPKYRGTRAQAGGWCAACSKHSVSNPFELCDLEIERAKDIEANGFAARHCFHCRTAYPTVLDRGSICPICQRKQDAQDERVRREMAEQKRFVFRSSGVRIDDGFGCTERVPEWMVEWDGDPGHKEPR